MNEVSNWQPNTTYVWTRKQIDQWADETGSLALYNGAAWEIRYKRITPGRYKVWFERWKPEPFPEQKKDNT